MSGTSPSTPATPSSQYTYYDYSVSPSMYTREDVMALERRRDRLEGEIALLQDKLEALKQESDKVKSDRVSKGDLALLKAQTRDGISETCTNSFGDSLTEFSDQIREFQAAKAMCHVFEQQIKSAESEKRYRTDEARAIENLFNFERFGTATPLLTFSAKDTDSGFDDAIQGRLKQLNHDLNEHERRKGLTELERDGALSVSEATDAKCRVSAAKSRGLKIEVSHYENVVAEQARGIRKATDDGNHASRKLATVEAEAQQLAVEEAEQMLVRKAVHERECEQLDKEMEGIRERINEEAARFAQLKTELEKRGIQEEEPAVDMNQDEFSTTELFQSDVDEDEVPPRPIETSAPKELILTRNALEFEIAQMEKSMDDERSRCQRREDKLKEDIQKVYKRYKERRRLVQRLAEEVDSSSSRLQRDIVGLMGQIDGSISGLKT